jgi:UDP-N-acetylmuramate--alanine ligase
MEATGLHPARRLELPAAPGELRNARIHMVGIGGSGMAGLAAMLLRHGARVSGTDRANSPALTKLAAQGAVVSTREDASAVPPDAELVVASAAIPPDHPELVAARARGQCVIKYAEMLGYLFERHTGVAISGTHGKSTTTAWLAFVLHQAGLEPSFVVGADCAQLGGGSGVGDGPYFVAEACEYDRSFLNLRPRYAAILNIEEDHLDCYEDLAAIRAAFEQFAGRVAGDGLLVLNGQDEQCRWLARSVSCPTETFAISDEATWRACDLRLREGRYECAIRREGRELGRVWLGIAGRHNVLNALAVAALAQRCGVNWEATARSLSEFRGTRRRLELRGEVDGIRVADDYAHHPTEIRATLAAAWERFAPQRLWCVFQPHQHSRTRFLLEHFARSFGAADEVLVPDIYFVRDSQRERERVSAVDLVERIRDRGGSARYLPDFGEIVGLLIREVRRGDLILTMGAGDIWKVADELVRRLRADLPA